MFKRYECDLDYFFQWDSNCKLIVEDASITEVHFCNRTDNCSLVCETYVEDGMTLVNVPNILLQTDWCIHVYAFDKNYTKHEERFEIMSRTKPSDYVYTETEVLTWNYIKTQLDSKANVLDLDNLESVVNIKADKATTLYGYGITDGATKNDIDALSGAMTDINNNIDAIDNVIPDEANINNKLADKDFVNSSIASNTAYFIGTFNSLEELENYSGTITPNDYAFVVTNDKGNTVYKRYKWSDNVWKWEYDLNNSSFTAEQWATINSGINSTWKNGIESDIDSIETTLANKANTSDVYTKTEVDNKTSYATQSSKGTVRVWTTVENNETVLNIATED